MHRRMIKKHRFVPVAAAVTVLFSGAALAQTPTEQSADDGTNAALPEVRVSTIAPAPLPSTTSVTSADLQDKFITDWRRMGAEDPGVDWDEANRTLTIRGMDQNRLLMTVDGIRLPDYYESIRTNRSGNDMVEFGSLSSLDIIRNGADSDRAPLGAEVNLHTLEPADLIAPGKTMGALVKSDYQGADSSWGLQTAIATRWGDSSTPTSMLLQLGGRRGHELDNQGSNSALGSTRTTPNPTDTTKTNGLLKLQQVFEGGHRLALTGEFRDAKSKYENDTASSAATTLQQVDPDEQKRRRLSLQYDYDGAGRNGWIDGAQAIAWWQKLDQGYHYDSYSRTTGVQAGWRDESYSQNMYGLQGHVDKRIVAGGATNDIRLGGEWWHSRVEQYTGDKASSSAYVHVNQRDMPTTDATAYGLTLRDRISWDDGRFALTPALRYDNYQYRPKSDAAYEANSGTSGLSLSDASGSQLSPKLLAEWRATPSATLYTSYAYGYRAPTPQEMYVTYGSVGTYLEVGNPDLKAEKSRTLEAGARLGNQQLGGNVSAFYSRYRNFIDQEQYDDPRYPLAGITEYFNRSRVRIYGLEATGHWTFLPGWTLDGGIVLANGQDLDTDQHVNSVAPVKVNLGLAYARESWGANVRLQAAGAHNKVADATDFKTPGYGVVDLGVWWKPSMVKNLRLSAGITNLFDRKYWKYTYVPTTATSVNADYYTQPGRALNVAATWQY